MKKTILFLFILLSSSQLFAQIDENISDRYWVDKIINDSRWKISDSLFYQTYKGKVLLYEVDSTLEGRRILRNVPLDGEFWKGYESERDLYYMEDAKKRGAYILGPIALVSFALVAGISAELGAPEFLVIASGVGALFLTVNMFTISSKTNRRKEEILRRRLGAPTQPQTQLKLTGSSNGIGISLHF